jgi:hypothetical protein
MTENSLAMAVAQSVDQQPWDDSPVIPKDDSAVVTTLLPLVGLLVVYGAVLLSSLQSSPSESPMADTLISTRTP